MMRLFNPVWLVLIVAMAALFLASCDNKPAKKTFYAAVDADEIAMTDIMNGASDWSRFFVDLYPPVMACANHHPSQPAIVVDASPMNKGRALAVIEGKDKSTFECVIEMNDDEPESWKPAQTTDLRGPIFRPEGAGLPLPDSCLNNIPVRTTKNASVGWLSYKKPNCGGE